MGGGNLSSETELWKQWVIDFRQKSTNAGFSFLVSETVDFVV